MFNDCSLVQLIEQIGKEMTNIYLKFTIEKNWRSGWGAPTHADFLEFWNFLLQVKNLSPGSKSLCRFSVILLLKGIMTLKSPCFCLTKIKTLIKMNWNRK